MRSTTAAGFVAAGDAMIGLLVEGQARGEQGAKAGFVAEQRAIGHGGAAGQQISTGQSSQTTTAPAARSRSTMPGCA